MFKEDVIQKINKLGAAINTAKADKAKYEGAMEQIMNTLKQSYNFASVSDATEYITQLEDSISKKEKEVEEIYKHLTENYSW